MKKIVVFGAYGGLGSKVSELLEKTFQVVKIGSDDVDVTDFEKVKELFDTVNADVVLNMSGYNYDAFMHKYGTDNQKEIDKLIDVNIKGNINIARACLPHMRDQNFGRIIMISSILAESPVVSTGIYAGSKGFLDSFAKTVAIENAHKGVTCNTLQLGYFDAGLTYKIPEVFRNQIKESIPLKRYGSIQELVDVIEMLIKVEYITGTSLKVNGGLDF